SALPLPMSSPGTIHIVNQIAGSLYTPYAREFAPVTGARDQAPEIRGLLRCSPRLAGKIPPAPVLMKDRGWNCRIS
ncbi:hypothetical protein, partial [Novosphingobium endophyticum]|uniref:hypothetical protein n=1 Tax=Novosphingobium endophyticum TaxID=1955250 RepID=UPI001E3F4910